SVRKSTVAVTVVSYPTSVSSQNFFWNFDLPINGDKVTYHLSLTGHQCGCKQVMGNTGSGAAAPGRDHHHKPGDPPPSSPGKDGGQAFVFDKKPATKLVFQSSHEEEEPYYTKDQTQSHEERYLVTTKQEKSYIVTDSLSLDWALLMHQQLNLETLQTHFGCVGSLFTADIFSNAGCTPVLSQLPALAAVWTDEIKGGRENNQEEFSSTPRQRSATVSEGTKVDDKVPTVFKWEGGGRQVLISGTFSNWKTLPMVKSHTAPSKYLVSHATSCRSHGDFVTIIDLPEGEHQYKFYVDGEWRHDPGV
ncbi:unnamed protein product, partial [Timema podura]|nr:unnamed protein product [Timema podura]